MSLFDRISQLTDENAILRTQLRDAQEQAKRDTETIARLSSHKGILRAAATDAWKWSTDGKTLETLHYALKCTP